MTRNPEFHEAAFEAWLNQSAAPAPSADFAERIILASLERPQRKPFTLRGLFEWLAGDLPLPHPALAFASILMAVFVAGFAYTALSANEAAESVEMAMYDNGESL